MDFFLEQAPCLTLRCSSPSGRQVKLQFSLQSNLPAPTETCPDERRGVGVRLQSPLTLPPMLQYGVRQNRRTSPLWVEEMWNKNLHLFRASSLPDPALLI